MADLRPENVSVWPWGLLLIALGLYVVAVAALIAGDVQYFENVDPEKAWAMSNMLLRTPAPEELAQLM